ncbi:hypothetical protein NtRootA1_43150 [Arthrobacter sp. NtRootA1]|nr:hypothetical protein NtRootA1_43150 [Arthrobacter sp. NtRootA1]
MINLFLLLTPPLGQAEIAKKQEEHESNGRDEENSQKPGHGRSGATVARDDAQQHDAHDDFRNDPSTQEPGPFRAYRKRKKHSTTPTVQELTVTTAYPPARLEGRTKLGT